MKDYNAIEAKRYARENKRCAEIIRRALHDIRKASNERADAPFDEVPYRLRTKDDYETALTDLLANARHFADSKGLDYFTIDDAAQNHYTVEVVQARTGVEG